MTIRVVPASVTEWDGVRAVLGGDGDRGCWCQYWRCSAGDYRVAPRARALREQLAHGPPPGLIAYVGDEPAGWLGLWPRPMLERLARSRTIPRVDDRAVWSIVCFATRVGYRRRGVGHALLAGAIDTARAARAPGLEAYPIDAGDQRVDVAFAYVGLVRMFESAGFRRVVETDARSAGRPRILMRLDF